MLGHFITLADASWLMHPIYALFLTIDGIIYSLVSYAYKLFMLLTQLNYNILYDMLSPLIDRMKAVIMVFILFKVGVAFLQYLVDPQKFDDKTKGGTQLVINVLIVAGLLGISSFVFALFNDLSMIVLGTFGGSGSFQVIKVESGDSTIKSGLLARFIFGSNEQVSNSENFGKFLATSTLNIFLHDKEESKNKEAASIYSSIIDSDKNKNDDFDIMRIVDLSDDIGRTVEYRYPLLSTVIGLYLVYSIVKIAISVGVRMFKLIVLQIIAPIPIISIVSDGVNGQTFKKFTKLYTGTVTNVFITVGSMYLTTGFISSFYQLLIGTVGNTNTDLFNSASSLGEISTFTRYMLMIILMVAGYTFVNMLPKFLSEIFGNTFEEDKGFGKFLKGVVGSTAGAVGGYALGRASGLGFGDSLLNAGASAWEGGKGGKIADILKNSSTRAAGADASGGMIRNVMNNLSDQYGIKAARDTKAGGKIDTIQKQGIKPATDHIEELQRANEMYKKVSDAASSEVKGKATNFGSYGTRSGVTSANDLFARVKSSDADLAKLQYALKNAKNDTEYNTAYSGIAAREEALRQSTEAAYNNAIDATTVVQNSNLEKAYSQREATVEANSKEIDKLTEEKRVKEKEIEKLNKAKEGKIFSNKRNP